ncbi:hypothetical protein ACEN9F_05275 [Duganella sp. CT11-25]|uniref:hypothetical protein n=1 Tax=unclassified Duganella TaxID=2636909 RepID=UPI0039AF8597
MKRLAMLAAMSASCAAAMAQPGQSIAQLASDKAALRKAPAGATAGRSGPRKWRACRHHLQGWRDSRDRTTAQQRHPDYDAAVLRAINQASPLPIQVEGASTRQITLSVLMR